MAMNSSAPKKMGMNGRGGEAKLGNHGINILSVFSSVYE